MLGSEHPRGTFQARKMSFDPNKQSNFWVRKSPIWPKLKKYIPSISIKKGQDLLLQSYHKGKPIDFNRKYFLKKPYRILRKRIMSTLPGLDPYLCYLHLPFLGKGFGDPTPMTIYSEVSPSILMGAYFQESMIDL